MREMATSRRPWRLIALFGLLALAVVPAATSQAEDVWVKDEVHLNLRSGAGNQFRILGRIKTGDTASILSRGDGWTQVRTAKGLEGWVPAGFLQTQPPASVVLESLEAETASLSEQVRALTKEVGELRLTNDQLSAVDGDQRAEIERLSRNNFELRAKARWPEWITGGSIILLGMALGAILSLTFHRRRTPRIRL